MNAKLIQIKEKDILGQVPLYGTLAYAIKVEPNSIETKLLKQEDRIFDNATKNKIVLIAFDMIDVEMYEYSNDWLSAYDSSVDDVDVIRVVHEYLEEHFDDVQSGWSIVVENDKVIEVKEH